MSFPDQQPATGSIYIPGPETQHFGHPSTWPATPAQPPPVGPPPLPPVKSSKLRWWHWALVAAIAIAFAAGAANETLGKLHQKGSGDRTDRSDAQLVASCHASVVAKLKAPSTATFPTYDQIGWLSETQAKVSGNVDAQNSFGAMIRQAYTCDATKDGVRWSITSVTFR